MTDPDAPSTPADRVPVTPVEPDELDDLGVWAGAPRGTHKPKAEEFPEEEALPPEGPAGVTPSVPAGPPDQES
ncbi:hypothetical protein [Streptomyces spectabilis]|uniref:Uncharacterized protein n=1 Tax=Streptomyces spectabilis TaxID=68270 RepID=A0A5P2XK31_STRST|nr:hypothetical protein [Streptomyces spectabilis]MBB5105335.1 hypothetical protein [Streptomyces spectabilis]MCI3906528.1 hypothetical protein [Streptomyces spectabilis]QEV63360.1 hypothetical protein CP982_35520 [Streptomyces spectabilis]GGV21019.1 hypothetical protein GCM10010245_35320 [Streptomyces spectabilis]